jgi:modulator of FtsH protease HflC
MNLFRSSGIIVIAILALVVWSSTFIVDERKKALVLRFGEINRIVEKPGLYFKIPVADDVVPIEDRMILWTSDKRFRPTLRVPGTA